MQQYDLQDKTPITIDRWFIIRRLNWLDIDCIISLHVFYMESELLSALLNTYHLSVLQ